eukprot:661281-Prymnesium_polylepis.3
MACDLSRWSATAKQAVAGTRLALAPAVMAPRRNNDPDTRASDTDLNLPTATSPQSTHDKGGKSLCRQCPAH